MWDTEDGSISLSYFEVSMPLTGFAEDNPYWDLLLRQDDSAVLATDAYCHDVCGGDGFECIF